MVKILLLHFVSSRFRHLSFEIVGNMMRQCQSKESKRTQVTIGFFTFFKPFKTLNDCFHTFSCLFLKFSTAHVESVDNFSLRFFTFHPLGKSC